MFCQKCGAQLPENAEFFPYCGKKVEKPFQVKQEVVDKKPEPQKQEQQRKPRYTDEQIDKMRVELADHRRRQSNFSVAGGVLLGVGIALFVIGLIVCISSTIAVSKDGQGTHAIGIVLGSLCYGFGIAMIIAGIPLLIVASAVFGKKADNRQRAIKEHEQGK